MAQKMAAELCIEPVPSGKHTAAIVFMLAGSRKDEIAVAQGRKFQKMTFASGARRPHLWWARRGRRCYAVTMVVPNAGRTGTLLHCPIDAPGVDVDALTLLVEIISLEALADGLSLVQSLLPVGADQEANLLQRGGYSLLAELVYMECDLPFSPREDESEIEPAGVLTWRNHDQFSEEELARVIESTYNGSLDCPALTGVRRINDVLASHRASGIFTPQSWLIVSIEGVACGCVLVNDARDSSKVEIVYAGVCPSCRGRGLGRAMLRRAARDASLRGRTEMVLAVGAANIYAIRTYEAAGFRQTDRRIVYVMLRRPAEE